MKRYFNVILTLFLLIIVMSFASADQSIPPVKVGNCAQLIQTCANCTFVNTTGVHYPNLSVTYTNIAMTKNINVYNYTFCGNDILGTYVYDTFGDPDGNKVSASVSYEVTTTGQLLNSSKAVLYIVILFIALLLMALFITLGLMISGDNKRDEMTGYILAVSNVKYIKLFSWALAYLCLMLILRFGYIISYSFLDMDFIANLFNFTFYASVAALFPLFILFVYIVGANAVRDSKIGDALLGGLRIRE